ncbi:MAG: hypothetical protein DMG24_09875, partial [Acidobacteria bacterium]
MESSATSFERGAAVGLLVVAATAMSLRAQAVPSSPAALVKHGNELSRQEKWKEAADAYREALALKPNDAEA